MASASEPLALAAAHIARAERCLSEKSHARALDQAADAASRAIAVLEPLNRGQERTGAEAGPAAAALRASLRRLNERMRHLGLLQLGRLTALSAGQLGYSRGGTPVCDAGRKANTLAEL